MKVPYNDLELRMSLFSVDKKVTEETMEKTAKLIETTMPEMTDKVAFNKAVAEYNGISVDTLINSPNYDKLTEEFQESKVHQIIDLIEKELGLTNKEAWALFCVGTGSLREHS